MIKRIAQLVLAILAMITFSASPALACTPTGFFRDAINMTAALINPVDTVSGTVDAIGCNIAVYYDSNGLGGTVKAADIFGSNYFGVLVNGDAGPVSVDVLNSTIHDIGESPLNGSQHGVAVYYRAFFLGGGATGKINGNTIERYQKGGIVVNGVGSNAVVSNNIVRGLTQVTFIAQNGVQFGYGSSGSAMRNTVTGNQYDGTGTASGGIIVVGGPGYGTCPDGFPCPYTTGIQIVRNIVTNNDVGVWLSNIDELYNPPVDQTNEKVVNNTISNDTCVNPYQTGVSDQGNNDKIINNRISGIGYATTCGVAVDADVMYTNRPKVHANK